MENKHSEDHTHFTYLIKLAWLSNVPSGVDICRNRGHDGDGEQK